MSKIIRLNKGLDIKLNGEPEKTLRTIECRRFAVKPTDFRGVVPKLLVSAGDKVRAGTALFFDKHHDRVIFCSPVSGTIIDIVRGPKRVIEEIRIECDGNNEFVDLGHASPLSMSREDVVARLLTSGAWPFLRQRPYSVIANSSETPKSIHVSAFDSSPLAPDYDFILENEGDGFRTGIEVLKKLTSGIVHLNVHATKTQSKVILETPGVQINHFSGPHPSGNVGIQIHHIDPINKGDVVWYVNPQDVVVIGKVFNEGRYDAGRIYAITGSELNNPHYVKSHIGVNAWDLVSGGFKDGHIRMISGNVLTGDRLEKDGYMGFYHHQFTAIPEGRHHEFIGWALPGFGKFSVSRSYFSWLMPGKRYRIDTNLHGGHRAYVVTGEYERVLPMNIYPVQLIKSIIIDDIELMENLGIYEVDEEDFALCEVVCTSKTEVQSIIRRGLDLMRKEMS